MWFFRAVQADDGQWSCRRGLQEFDRHPDLAAALDHIRDMAAGLPAVQFFVHHLDGRVDHHNVVGDRLAHGLDRPDDGAALGCADS